MATSLNSDYGRVPLTDAQKAYMRTPEFQKQYADANAKRWYEIQNHIGPYADYSGGGFLSSLGNFLDPIMETTISATPYLMAASLGDAAGLYSLGGMFGGGGEAAGASAGAGSAAGAGATDAGMGWSASDLGLGSVPIDTSSLGSMSWADGLGSGLGSDAGLLTGGSLGSVPVNTDILGSVPSNIGVSSGGGSMWGNLGNILSNGSSSTSGLGNLFGGVSDILGANHDRITNQQDQEYWDNLMNHAMNMYAPGSPEANLMEQKMNAADAAAGRNSQYGTRATNLAGMLADQRARIMTSPAFYQMGAASRGHYDNSLNSLFGAMGQMSNSGSSGSGWGSLFSGLGSLGNTTTGVLGSIGTGLSDLFGGFGGI